MDFSIWKTCKMTVVEVSFGDCDPAGIVFYPNYFAWADRAFHDFLRPLGGHAALCAKLGALGIGLISADARFRRPVRDGDSLTLTCRISEWSDRSFTLEYVGSVDAEIAVKVKERRGVLCASDNGIFAAETTGFRLLVENVGQGRE
jgi:4-hydroxybenzoyl-CoA thioesterase